MTKQERRDLIKRECERRHIRVEQRGQAYALRGPGVDLIVNDLAYLVIADLNPLKILHRQI